MGTAYIYLLRAPLIGGLVLAALTPLALWSRSPAAPLLHGTFDVGPASVAVITFFTGLLVMALTLSTEMVVRYGAVRFALPPPSAWLQEVVWSRETIVIRRYSLIAAAAYTAAGLTLVGGLLAFGQPPLIERAIAATAGIAAAFTAWGLTLQIWSDASPSANWLATIVLWTPAGYLEAPDADALRTARKLKGRRRPTLLPGHGLLAVATLVTFAAYFVFGFSKYVAISCGGGRQSWVCTLLGLQPKPLFLDGSVLLKVPAIPTLASLIVLMTLVVYVTAGLAFLLDRFRIPIVLPIVAMAAAAADWPQSDNVYHVEATPGPRIAVSPARALAARHGDSAIVVTASGGGIHAAGWTASVLAQLEQETGDEFHRSIRLISAVSGGSVGTMYVVDAIEKRAFSGQTALEKAFVPAATSSLDDIAWGFVYPDLARLFAPFLFRIDRGVAAELAWRRLAPDLDRPLSTWRAGALSGDIPSVVFNATLADTGGRLALGTTDLGVKRGLQSFGALYDEEMPPVTVDPSIVTAARLSATFTYVSPAARIDRPVRRSVAYHVVDGGYFDNFGVASGVDWLDLATRQPTPVAHVLIVQVRGPVALQDPLAKPSRGALGQIAAPFNTLLNYRAAAQVAHNNLELQLLCRTLASRGVAMETAVFQYPKCTAPLSWHLTAGERDELWDQYAHEALNRPRGRVRAFLGRDFTPLGNCDAFDESPPIIVDPSCR